MKEYIRAFEGDVEGNIGVVACKVVYLTGQLQEAGSMVFRGGEGHGYGRMDDPSDEKYVCGACLAIRNDVFDFVGKIDEEVFPSYYSDTDLCMKVRFKARKSVVYTPHAQAIHMESLTYGNKGRDLMAIAKCFARSGVES